MIVKTGADAVPYIKDTSNIPGSAEKVYVPSSIDGVVSVMRDHHERGVPLTFSAGGTGTTGGRTACGGDVLSVEALDKTVFLDTERKRIRVQAGVPLAEAEKRLNLKRLSLRAQPTEPLALTSGVVSTCASGPKSFKYGSIRAYVRALRVVFSDGCEAEIERGVYRARGRSFDVMLGKRRFVFGLPSYRMPDVKHAAGYFVEDGMDLIDLFIGSEGTLCCIVEVEFDVQPMPKGYFDLIAWCDDEDRALSLIESLRATRGGSPHMPCAVEFYDGHALGLIRQTFEAVPKASCAVYVIHELEDRADLPDVVAFYAAQCNAVGIPQDAVWASDDRRVRERMADMRHRLPVNINEFLRERGTRKAATDAAVPDTRFREMFAFYLSIADRYRVKTVMFGHIGQSHLHFNFLPESSEQNDTVKEALREILAKAVDLGGTVSAEHGIGKLKKDYLRLMFGDGGIEEMRALKRVFDPRGILNRGTMFDL